MRPPPGDRNEHVPVRRGPIEAPHSEDAQRRRPVPPIKTHAEEYYFIKQMTSRTPMIVALATGEELRGWVEWYDEHCIKLNRQGAPNLLLYKRYIRYLYKDPAARQE